MKSLHMTYRDVFARNTFHSEKKEKKKENDPDIMTHE